MAYDHKTRTIHIEQGSDFHDGFGLFVVKMLKTFAEENESPAIYREEWAVLESWLGAQERDLNEEDDKKISTAWRSYIAKGISPSLELQSTFAFAAQTSKDESWELMDVPAEIIHIFECQIATKEQMDAKKLADFRSKKNVLGSVKKGDERNKALKKLSKNRKLFFSVTFLWSLWVIARTVTEFEIMGFYFRDWDEDIFFVNLLLPPFITIVLFYMHKWVSSD